MSDDRRPTDWPDERLEAAFRTRATHRRTPDGLAADAIGRLATARPRRAGRARPALVAGIGVAATVVVAIALGTIGLPPRPPAAPTSTILAALPTATEVTAGPPDALPVIDVAAAVAVR